MADGAIDCESQSLFTSCYICMHLRSQPGVGWSKSMLHLCARRFRGGSPRVTVVCVRKRFLMISSSSGVVAMLTKCPRPSSNADSRRKADAT